MNEVQAVAKAIVQQNLQRHKIHPTVDCKRSFLLLQTFFHGIACPFLPDMIQYTNTRKGAGEMRFMKSLQIQNAENASVVELPVPVPGEGQALVEVTCPQWDLHIYFGKPMFVGNPPISFPYPPGQPGHEMTGTVVEAGPGCNMQPGQSVCAWRDPGKINPGCYAEYVVLDEKDLLPIPEHLPCRKVASLELAMCVASSILRLKQAVGIAGKACGVNALGPAGLIALQMLLAEGAESVVGIDPNPERRVVAKRLGAVRTVDPGEDALVGRNKPGALAVTIDCLGYPSSVKYAMDHTKQAVALFGVQRDDYILGARHRGLDIINFPGHFRESAEYALQLIVEDRLDLSPLISRELSFEQYELAIDLLKKQEAIKICFVPSLGKAMR
jgi:threonine dehydrogenase-like Zn-dependent dehydrogenase